jgi:hypothetical protein
MIVSFTTTPSRISKTIKTIQSILNQTFSPTEILLNVPRIFGRTGETYKIPKEIQNIVKVIWCDDDYGPGTKIIPTIKYLKEREYPDKTQIVYIDDDIIYPSGMLKTMYEKERGIVYAASGFIFKDLEIYGIRDSNSNCDIVEGYGGVCVELGMFKEDFMDYISKCICINDIKFSDDLYLSNYYSKYNYDKKIISEKNYSFNSIWEGGGILEYGDQEDALHNGANTLVCTNGIRYINVLELLSRNNSRYFNVYISSSMERNGKCRLVCI